MEHEEIRVMTHGEAFICPSCGEAVGPQEVFTVEPSGISDPSVPLGYMKVRCASCSPLLEKELYH